MLLLALARLLHSCLLLLAAALRLGALWLVLCSLLMFAAPCRCVAAPCCCVLLRCCCTAAVLLMSLPFSLRCRSLSSAVPPGGSHPHAHKALHRGLKCPAARLLRRAPGGGIVSGHPHYVDPTAFCRAVRSRPARPPCVGPTVFRHTNCRPSAPQRPYRRLVACHREKRTHSLLPQL